MSGKLAPPFFSIILPTKNRAQCLNNALLSIKNQSYDSYELIVVDNDDSEDTKNVCNQVENEKMRYFRTGGLNMFDNWNFAVNYARGKWVLFLEDKQALYIDTLKVISDTILKEKIDTALVFEIDYYNDTQFENFGIVTSKTYSGRVTSIDTNKLLRQYEANLFSIRHEKNVSDDLPKPQNSVVSLQLQKEIKEKFGEYFLFGALDFTSALAKLILSKTIYKIELGLLLVTTMKVSNGLFSAIYREKAHCRDMKIAPDEYKKELLKLPFPEFSMTNVFYVDYLILRKKIDSNFTYNLNKENYFKCIFKDIYNIHAVIRRVPLKNSMKKYLYYLRRSDLSNRQKTLCVLFAIKHIIVTHLYLCLLKSKHTLDKFRSCDEKSYSSPLDRVSDVSILKVRN